MALFNAGISLIRAQGNTRVSMTLSLIMNAINIAGNALLIYGFDMAVTGAAIATLFARAVVAVIVFKMLLNKNLKIHIGFEGFFKFDRPIVANILGQGIPGGIENCLFQLGKLLVMGVVATLPTAMRAANGVAANAICIVNCPGGAVGLAATALISPMIGAGDKEGARRLGHRLVKLMYALELPINLIMVAIASPLARLYGLSADGLDGATRVIIAYSLLAIVLWTPALGLPYIIKSAGDAKYTMLCSMLSMMILRVGSCYLYVYVFDLGLQGIWMAQFTDWVGRAVCYSLRLKSGRWLEKSAIR